MLVISITRIPLLPKWRNLQEALLMMFTLLHLFEIFLAFIPRDWKQVKQVDCNTCLSHVICMLFLAVIISTVLHGVLKTRTYHDRNKCNIPCIYVCNPISLHANLILNPFYLFTLFAELQSYSYCQAFFFLLKKNKF